MSYSNLSVNCTGSLHISSSIPPSPLPTPGNQPSTQRPLMLLQCFARKYVRDMERHPPWVMKDPRMALTMPLWRPHIKDLVCVFVHKDPIKNSISLAANGKKSSHTRTPPHPTLPHSSLFSQRALGCPHHPALSTFPPGIHNAQTSNLRHMFTSPPCLQRVSITPIAFCRRPVWHTVPLTSSMRRGREQPGLRIRRPPPPPASPHSLATAAHRSAMNAQHSDRAYHPAEPRGALPVSAPATRRDAARVTTGDTDMMTPQRWLSLWETTMLYGLEGCRGVPTVFFSSSNIIPDIRGALTTLKGLLEAVGVRGLKMPSDGEIQDRIQRYIFTGEREYKINKGAQARLNLPEIPITDTTPPTPSHAQVRRSAMRRTCAVCCWGYLRWP